MVEDIEHDHMGERSESARGSEMEHTRESVRWMRRVDGRWSCMVDTVSDRNTIWTHFEMGMPLMGIYYVNRPIHLPTCISVLFHVCARPDCEQSHHQMYPVVVSFLISSTHDSATSTNDVLDSHLLA